MVGVALQEAESEATSAVFRDRPSVKSLAHRFERNSSRRKSSVFSSSSARKKWRDFEKKVKLLFLKSHTHTHLGRHSCFHTYRVVYMISVYSSS